MNVWAKRVVIDGGTITELYLKHETCVTWTARSTDGEVVAEGVIGGCKSLDDPELLEAVETKILLAKLCKRVAEFRLEEEGVPWRDIPVLEEGTFCPQDGPDERAIELVKEHGREVRWNWKGSSRGHYIFEVAAEEPAGDPRPTSLHPACPECGENLRGDALVRLEGVTLAEDGFTYESYEGSFHEIVLTYCPSCGWREGGTRYYLTGEGAKC